MIVMDVMTMNRANTVSISSSISFQNANNMPENGRTFESILVRHCAPTLTGIKPGSIFSIHTTPCVHTLPNQSTAFMARETAHQKVRQWNARLNPTGLSLRLLLERQETGFLIVYLYRRNQLKQTLFDRACQRFLIENGYQIHRIQTLSDDDLDVLLDDLLAQLARRLRTRTQSDFPHEIGLFLGYPLQDVIGFIQNHGQNFTCSGFWKSYSDPVEMQARFSCYRSCIQSCVRQFQQGIPIEKLAVSA